MRKVNYKFYTQELNRPIPETPGAGAYACTILEVEDHPAESYLNIKADINDGPYARYYASFRAEHPDWRDPLTFRKYYTPAALSFFKRFCDAASRSNGNYAFDGDTVNSDEKTLIGKKIGLVLQAREYYTNSGDLRTRLEVLKEIPVDRVPYEPVPPVLTIAKQEEIKARKAARQAARQSTPAPAQPAPAPAPAQAFTQQPAQPAKVAPAPAQAFAQQPQQVIQPAQAPAYQQAPAQAGARQTAAPTYAQAQQPAQQAYAQNPALAQFVDVSGDAEMMPFM